MSFVAVCLSFPLFRCLRARFRCLLRIGSAFLLVPLTPSFCVLRVQGVLGINMAIMLPYDPEGKQGSPIPQPDVVIIHEPKVRLASFLC